MSDCNNSLITNKMSSSLKDWWSLPQSKFTIIIIVGMVILGLLSKWTGQSEPKYSKKFTRQLKRVVQQASKWHTTARQDMDPLVNLIHSNYALAYANVARAIASDGAIEGSTGIKLRELMYYLEEDQKRALQAVTQRCPDLRPTGIYTTGNAWM